MKNIFKLFCIVVLFLSVNSCGVAWQIQSVNQATAVDTLYDVDVITSRSQLNWKMQRDWNFANNYYAFLQRQNYSFFHNQYFYNRLNRFGWQSPHDYWMNWQWSWHSGYSNNWMWNQYPYYGNWGSSQWYWNQWNNPWQYSYTYGPRTQWLGNVYGRRSSNRNRFVYSNSNRSRSILVSDGSTSDSRTYLPNTASPIQNQIIRNNNKPRVLPNSKPLIVNNKPVVINKPPSNNNNIWKPTINNSKPVIRNNNNNKPRINNSSSRPNFNRPVSRPSSPKTNSSTNRKGKNPR